MLAERVVEWTKEWKEQGLEQGRQQGMQEGIQQGMQQGEAAILKRLLTIRFGRLPQSTHDCLDQASIEELERWSEQLLSATNLDEVFN